MRIALPESAPWPLGDRTELSADEFNDLVSGRWQTGGPVPPAAEEAVPDWTTNEKKFMARIVKYATEHGWMTYHVHNSANSAPGYPDLVLVRGERKVAAELKVPPHKPTKDQLRWLAALAATGDETYAWYPDDIEEIERILGR